MNPHPAMTSLDASAPALPACAPLAVPASGIRRAVSVARGDGVGPEITEAALSVLDAAGAPLAYRFVALGDTARREGAMTGIAPGTWETLRETGVLLQAPVNRPRALRVDDPGVMLRKALGLFARVRPARAYAPIVYSPHPAMDVVVISESEEGLHGAAEHRQSHEVAQCITLASRPGCERIVRYAFEYTRGRNRKRLTCMTRDAALPITDGMFRDVFEEIAAEYPDVEAEHVALEQGMSQLCVHPERFDVIVTGNQHGNLLSGVAAELTGSPHAGASASIGEAYSMFETTHDAAWELAGQDLANPSGLILASVKMLAHLGHGEIAERIHNAWLCTIEDGIHTPDIHRDRFSRSRAGTREFAEAVVARLGETPRRLIGARYPRLPTLIPVPSRRRGATRVMAGVDVVVRFDGEVEALAQALLATRTPDLALASISNRGIQVWPAGHPMTLCADQWCCRFLPERAELAASNESVIALLTRLRGLGLDFLKTEHLYRFDGEPGFTTGR